MSDQAVIETPAAAEVVTPPPVRTFKSFEDILKVGNPKAAAMIDADQKAAEDAKKPVEAEKAPDPTKETPEAEKTPEKAPVVQKATKEESLSELRKRAEAAAKERDELNQRYADLQKQYEEIKQKPFELPEEYKTRQETVEKELEEYRKELQIAALARDPQFKKKYETAMTQRIGSMKQLAVAAGVPEAEIVSAMGRWDQDKFGEWMDGMTAGNRVAFQSAWQDYARLWNDRETEIANAETTWKERHDAQTKAQEAYQKQLLSDNEKTVRSFIKEMVLDNESFKDIEGLAPEVEAVALKAARYELTPQEVFKSVIASQSLARVTKKQHERIQELEAKLKEQDEFIKSQASSIPQAGRSGTISNGAKDEGPSWKNIRVAT